ncbi:MAG: (2Fe-2S)-binding protein [Tissierellales bacterium]
MRIIDHPILEFNRGEKVKFVFNGKELEGYKGETIAAALHATGIKVLGESVFKHRHRGFYCAIGNCSSCNMVVNGEPNVRTCITELQDGMIVETQHGKGVVNYEIR